MGEQEKRGLQALIGGWDRLLPKPVCCALVVRGVKVGMMGDTDCACEEACDVYVSVLGVIQVNVQRWG
jgi:hypothetical protein